MFRRNLAPKLGSIRRRASKDGWTFTIDQAFEEVIRLCASVPRRGQQGTWITPEMHDAYVQFHQLGHAHSAEAWRNGRLVGGIYGVDVGGAFAAESMFHLESNASKLALLHLVDHLAERGLDWIDIQVMTPQSESLGARAIGRAEFLERLASTRRLGRTLF